jgi:hypothetical protein
VRSAVASLLPLSLAAALGCGGGRGNWDCDPFAHIVMGDFGRTADTLWWTMQVEHIPDQLMFNQLAVPPNHLEYRWAVDVDSDRNGHADLSVALSHFTVLGATPIATDILSVAQSNLWEVNGAVASTIGDVTTTITENTFRFEVAASEAPGLAVVSDRSQSTWTTLHRFGGEPPDQCEESWR